MSEAEEAGRRDYLEHRPWSPRAMHDDLAAIRRRMEARDR